MAEHATNRGPEQHAIPNLKVAETVNPFQQDAERGFAGLTHKATFPTAKRAARLVGHDVSTQHRQRKHGAPIHQHVRDYLRFSENPHEFEAFVQIEVKRQAVNTYSREDLCVRWWDLDIEIELAHIETRQMGARGESHIKRASADRHLIALIAERAAMSLRLEAERISESDLRRYRR